jgi:hypothetical protein
MQRLSEPLFIQPRIVVVYERSATGHVYTPALEQLRPAGCDPDLNEDDLPRISASDAVRRSAAFITDPETPASPNDMTGWSGSGATPREPCGRVAATGAGCGRLPTRSSTLLVGFSTVIATGRTSSSRRRNGSPAAMLARELGADVEIARLRFDWQATTGR